MKLRKALKVKNQLVKEINDLMNKINRWNSIPADNENKKPYSTKELYNELLNKVNKLTTLKLVIAKANENIQYEIFMLGEYKSLIKFLKGLNTNDGTQYEYGKNVPEVYAAEIKDTDIDNMIHEIESKIESLQETVDEYNATTEIDFE